MDSNLLKEAIADAKAVRQTALANAKVALEEAFSEKYHAMFAEKLKEDAEGNDQQSSVVNKQLTEDDSDVNTSEENISNEEIDELIKELESEVGEDKVPNEPNPDENNMDSNAEEDPTNPLSGDPAVPGADAPPMGAGAGAGAPPPMGAGAGAPPPMGAGAGAPPMGAGAGEVPVAPPGYILVPTSALITPSGEEIPGVPSMGAGAVSPPPMGAGSPPPSDVPPAGDEDTDEDVNLDELLESLKEEIEEEDIEEESITENAPNKSSGIGPGNNKQPSSDADTSSHISTASKSIKSGKVGWPDGKKIADDPETSKTSKENFGSNQKLLDKTAKLGKANESVETGIPDGEVTSKEPTDADRPNMGKNATKANLSTPALAKENAILKSQLNEAEETIKYVKGQLNEINLLNAKLLYTNKLFKEYNMSIDQKMKIVEMFDLSKNVRETKLTYANISESLNFSGGNIKRKVVNTTNSNVQSITEGLASKPVGSTKPSRDIISESRSAMVSKFQKLAGIKKS